MNNNNHYSFKRLIYTVELERCFIQSLPMHLMLNTLSLFLIIQVFTFSFSDLYGYGTLCITCAKPERERTFYCHVTCIIAY